MSCFGLPSPSAAFVLGFKDHQGVKVWLGVPTGTVVEYSEDITTISTAKLTISQLIGCSRKASTAKSSF